jgi:hypothetical protein
MFPPIGDANFYGQICYAFQGQDEGFWGYDGMPLDTHSGGNALNEKGSEFYQNQKNRI